MASDSKVFMFPDAGTTSNSSIDPALLMLLNQNGGFGGNGNWMWIFFLFFLWPLMRGGNFFGGNGTDNGFPYLANMANNDSGRELLMSAIQGNGNAISQLASTLNCDINSVKTAVNGVMSAIQQVGNQVGMTSMQTINAVQAGNCSLGQQIASCCCEVRESITTQGFESRLATLEQTNQLGSKIDNNTNAISQQIASQTTFLSDKFCDLEKRELQNRIDALREAKTSLENQISNSNQTTAIQNYIAATVTPLANEISSIKCQLPQTVTLPYSCATAVPTASLYNAYGFNGFNGINGYWG